MLDGLCSLNFNKKIGRKSGASINTSTTRKRVSLDAWKNSLARLRIVLVSDAKGAFRSAARTLLYPLVHMGFFASRLADDRLTGSILRRF